MDPGISRTTPGSAPGRLRLYDYPESGNAYKVRLLLHQLGLPFERVVVDILKGETRSQAFLERNPDHRVPLLEWPDGRRLAESNAILFRLAEGTSFLPGDAWDRARILQSGPGSPASQPGHVGISDPVGEEVEWPRGDGAGRAEGPAAG